MSTSIIEMNSFADNYWQMEWQHPAWLTGSAISSSHNLGGKVSSFWLAAHPLIYKGGTT
jgi:hypothetical protein